jgi:hypothetical protein
LYCAHLGSDITGLMSEDGSGGEGQSRCKQMAP